jgi:hypothetical protein
MSLKSNMSLKKGLVIIWLSLLAAAVGGIFWHSAWKYILPTPVPENYHVVQRGAPVVLPASAKSLATGQKPLFLHFFNPDCPCSRFNMPQFKTLVQQFGSQVDFAIVVMSPEKFTAAQLREKFDLPYLIPVVSDSAVAAACGVYSTPQAAILNTDNRLFYRGNYNRSRYCDDEKTGYARQALDSLLKHHFSLTLSPLAYKAYGCQLPNCTR